jgi:hypothetical protein
MIGIFTCTKCDEETKYYAKDMCRKCYEKNLRNNDALYKERQQKNSREWAINNKSRKYVMDLRYRNNPLRREQQQKAKKVSRLTKFGLTQETYQELCKKGCQICGALKYLHIDHDHSNGKFRGILCSRCNNGLGFLNDNIEGVEAALIYLKNTTQKEEQI